MFPWRCSRRDRCAGFCRQRRKTLRVPYKGSPPLRARLPSAVRFKLPVSGPFYARPGHPQLQAADIHPCPHSCHESCGANFRASPGRFAPSLSRLRSGKHRAVKAVTLLAGRFALPHYSPDGPAGVRSASSFSRPNEEGAAKEKSWRSKGLDTGGIFASRGGTTHLRLHVVQ